MGDGNFTKVDLIKAQQEMNKLCARADVGESDKRNLRLLYKSAYEAFMEEQNPEDVRRGRQKPGGFNTYRLNTPLGDESSLALAALLESIATAWLGVGGRLSGGVWADWGRKTEVV